MKEKKRLDVLVAEQYPQLSRMHIQSLIMQGKVHVEGQVVTKPGLSFNSEVSLQVDVSVPRFVSRAGFKLEAALADFNISVRDKVILDAGISTGGFTDCLLQAGAHRVYGIDVGYGQVHEKVANDPRVVVMERTNLRHLESLPEQIDIATLDLSFISVSKVLSAVKNLLKPGALLIVLIKPQFELEKHQIGRGGIVREAEHHQRAIEKVKEAAASAGFIFKDIIESPITGTDGNKEFLAWFVLDASQ
jgi:23S rRNA (cytidine1920-2'-O)/16S rRNA (cytidine1409-2'-O)-methyltransferase